MGENAKQLKKAGGKGVRYDPERNRAKVRMLAKVHTRTAVAQHLRISISTFTKYHEDDYQDGLNEVSGAIGAKIVEKALAGDGPSQRYYMDRRGGWAQRIEVTGPGGGPVQTFDASALPRDQRDALMLALEAMLSQRGIDPGALIEHDDYSDEAAEQ